MEITKTDIERIEKKLDLLLEKLNQSQKSLLTGKDMLEQYRQSEYRLRKARNNGELKYIREGNNFFYRPADVNKWIKSKLQGFRRKI